MYISHINIQWKLRGKGQSFKSADQSRGKHKGSSVGRSEPGGAMLLLLWTPFTGPTPWDTISLSYSHGILQGVLDFSLSQEHIPPAHPPKHALKSRDALPVNHTSHEAVGRRGRLGNLFHAMRWKALGQRRKVRREGQRQQTWGNALCQKGC